MNNGIIVINSGSTSLKFALYELKSKQLELIASGSYTEMQDNPVFKLKDAKQNILLNQPPTLLTSVSCNCGLGKEKACLTHEMALQELIPLLEQQFPQVKITYAGHRIVSGGERYAHAIKLDNEALAYLEELSKLEPTHQHFEVMGVQALAKVYPHIIQTASFDTSFHQTMPKVACFYAVPDEITKHGIRHWGYHGISYEYISAQLTSLMPHARKVIVAHLGGGASLCAMLDGKSIDTSMQFGAITGLPMATRSGDFPADAIFYLLKQNIYSVDELEKILSKNSGLLGVSSGLSESMKDIEKSNNQKAVFARGLFDYCLIKYIGAYTASLEGLDALIFTAGIGENDPALRSRICQKLSWLGVSIDENLNNAAICPLKAVKISNDNSKILVYIIPTNEELMIAQNAAKLCLD